MGPYLQAIVLVFLFESLASKQCCHLPLKLVCGHHSLEQWPHILSHDLLTVTQQTLHSSLQKHMGSRWCCKPEPGTQLGSTFW
jgi:hypothetical protein